MRRLKLPFFLPLLMMMMMKNEEVSRARPLHWIDNSFSCQSTPPAGTYSIYSLDADLRFVTLFYRPGFCDPCSAMVASSRRGHVGCGIRPAGAVRRPGTRGASTRWRAGRVDQVGAVRRPGRRGALARWVRCVNQVGAARRRVDLVRLAVRLDGWLYGHFMAIATGSRTT
jgi:hypothetical protein